MIELRDNQNGRCWDCGYLLRGVASARCPECGRAFDRDERSSMNFGRQMGRLGKWALGNLGWGATGLAAVGCGLVWGTVRSPPAGWRFSLVDLRLYGSWWNYRSWSPSPTGVDATYMAGLAILMLAIAAWVLRIGLRWAAVARYRPPAFQRGAVWRRTALLIGLCGLALLGAGVGWPYRLGQRWAAEYEFASQSPSSPPGYMDPLTPSFATYWPTYAKDGADPMLIAAVSCGDARQKRAGIKLLVETYPQRTTAILWDAMRSERDPVLRELEIRLLGVIRDPATADWLTEQLDDGDGRIRAAAADALGILRRPEFQFRNELTNWRDVCAPPLSASGDPPIDIRGLALLTLSSRDITERRWPERTRPSMQRVMLEGATVDEREAAARALLSSPPASLRLRYAEWGVFMADGQGQMQFVKEQLDEIPPFVHRIGNPLSELESRTFAPQVTVFKPVIHLTANLPASVDLQVGLAGGRPWVAYPMFDDLIELPNLHLDAPDLRLLDPAGLPAMNGLREGYPWMTPAHRLRPMPFVARFNPSGTSPLKSGIGGVGVRWQSLIVSPTRLPWMKPADVVAAADPRFAWWQRLRDVDCSWVSSRGESERFLYYDGPSAIRSPVWISFSKGILTVTPAAGINPVGSRRGLFIRVDKAGAGAAMHWLDGANRETLIDVAAAQPVPLSQAMRDLTRELEARGLTESEAVGMVDCWRPAFFDRPGARYLTFMTPHGYDQALPMTIRPTPAQVVRVGVIWTELDPEEMSPRQ